METMIGNRRVVLIPQVEIIDWKQLAEGLAPYFIAFLQKEEEGKWNVETKEGRR